jgi:ATP-dependent DNA ligase
VSVSVSCLAAEALILDSELMTATGEVWVFDAPYVKFNFEAMVLPTDPLMIRRAVLEGLFTTGMFEGTKVRLLKQAKDELEKQVLWEQVQAAGAEGVMVKHVDSKYQPGQRVIHSCKLKLVKTADVIVTARDQGGKIAQFAVYDEDGLLMRVGGCSMIGKPNAQVWGVIEVRYLYWTGEALYQPRMVRIRDDKNPAECTLAQFPAYSRAEV